MVCLFGMQLTQQLYLCFNENSTHWDLLLVSFATVLEEGNNKSKTTSFAVDLKSNWSIFKEAWGNCEFVYQSYKKKMLLLKLIQMQHILVEKQTEENERIQCVFAFVRFLMWLWVNCVFGCSLIILTRICWLQISRVTAQVKTLQ